jgi:signal transduction histidine kinase
MERLASQPRIYLDAFMKTAQYLASLPAHDDIWRHIAEVMVKFYGADMAGFAQRRPDGRLELHHLILPSEVSRELLEAKDIQTVFTEVLETGFLTWRVIDFARPHTVFFLPMSLGNESAAVMLVGHPAVGPVAKELLNVYLAVSGLAASTITRLTSERELEAYAQRLEQLNRELREFAFVASHDLREPLRKIQAFGHLMEDGCGESLTEQARDYVMRITQSAKRMSALLDAVLSYSRATEKPGPFALSDLSEIARDAVSDLELPITRAGAHVEIGPLPAAEVDPNQLRQLFQNLIANAIKYCEPGEPPHIKMLGEIKDKSCNLYIQDNGIGFSQKYVDRIFRPFQRLHGRTEYEGTGMGLAICRKIAERHGGNITAKSEPGQGSVFIVTLPLAQGGSEAKATVRKMPGSDLPR